VDADAIGDVGVAERDDEPQVGAVIPGDALGVDLHDLAHFQGYPVLLRVFPHDDVREPRQLADETIVGVLDA
jgi:hypothetical protein